MVDLVLRRPRGTAVIFAALLVLAIVSFNRVPLEGTPDATLPTLNITAYWTGADPEAICEQVTRPIEDIAREVEGVIEVSSTSRPDRSNVEVSFEKGTDMDVASMELTERISFLRDELPSAVMIGSVTQAVPRELTSEGFLIYAITGAEPSVLKQIADDIIVPRIERIEGISSVIVEGLGQQEIVLDIDRDALNSLDLTLIEIAGAVTNGIVDRNTGVAVDTSGLEAVIRLSTVPGTVAELEDLVVSSRGGRFVTLSDVTSRILVDYNTTENFIYRYNGMDQVSLQIDRNSSSNAVRAAGLVKKEIEELEADLPEGIELNLNEDGTEGITNDLKDLSWRALISLIAIVLILLLLNHSPLSTPLIISSIVFSAAMAVTAVYLAGYSINVLTLSALAIAFGLLVDGAVVVLEAIGFRRRQGMSPMDAADKGAKEVAMPILGGILTTMVALVPLLASEGILKLYYQPFAFTIAATLTASYFICLTLVPSIAGRWKSNKWYRERKWDRHLAKMIAVLHHRPLIAVILALLLVGGAVYVFLAKVEKGEEWGFSFDVDFIRVWMQYPPGTPQDVVDEVAKGFEDILANRDGIESTRTQVFGESAMIYSILTEEAVQTGYGLQIEAEAVAYATTLGGTRTVVVRGMNPEPYWRSTRSAGMMQTIELRGFDYQGLKDIALAMQIMLERHPRVGEVNINWDTRNPERNQLAVVFDRQELADLGVNPYQIFQAFRYNLAGGYGREIQIGDESIDMTFRIDGMENPELSNVLDSRITTGGGTMELGDIIQIDTLDVQGSVERENGEYIRTVAYSFMGAERMAARFRVSLLDNLELPSGYRVYEEEYIPFWLQDDGTDMNLIVLLAIIAVFAVTAIVFESFKAPLYILAVIPMAMVGVVAGFWIFDKVFSPQAYVGSVFLVGIAVNNSILLVDSFQKKKKAGIDIKKAADMVVAERLRPILQTSATTILGLLPLVLWPISKTNDLWENLSFTVVCGMLISTPLVLISLPALIQLTSRKGRKKK
ncbi:MAG: efflux RND transporter permease subunit [Candidatus Aegiribacteria sp.]|nr:efflux RND transporter permease subunit [Candidatus Aegiribacteria sp.]